MGQIRRQLASLAVVTERGNPKEKKEVIGFYMMKNGGALPLDKGWLQLIAEATEEKKYRPWWTVESNISLGCITKSATSAEIYSK